MLIPDRKSFIWIKDFSSNDYSCIVFSCKSGAIKLYEKNGFKEAGIRKDYYEKPKENAVIMWKQNL